MCAIIGWNGKLPPGLLTELLLSSEHRGRDSTGFAFRKKVGEDSRNFVCKRAVDATRFVKQAAKQLADAQESMLGLAHVRRASPNMPVNNANAHPFVYGSTVFAHNGVVRNWRHLRAEKINNFEETLKTGADAKVKTRLDFFENATTDSMILGACIEDLDFSQVVGCMGLIWLYGNELRCMRHQKELTSAVVKWSIKGGKKNTVAIVSSLWTIIKEALEAINSLDEVGYEAQEYLLSENTLYSIQEGKIVDEGPVPVNSALIVDKISSKED